MTSKMLSVIPVLGISDAAKAREFYIDYLGFTLEWEHRLEDGSPLYMHLSRGEVALHLSEYPEDASSGTRIFISLHGVEEYYRELIAKNSNNCRPSLEEAFQHFRSMQVTDPFGNRISFNEAPRGKSDGEPTVLSQS